MKSNNINIEFIAWSALLAVISIIGITKAARCFTESAAALNSYLDFQQSQISGE